MSNTVPLADEPHAGPDRDGDIAAASERLTGTGAQLSLQRLGGAAEGPLLKPVGDPALQQIARETQGGQHSIEVPPLVAQLKGGQLCEPCQLGSDIDRSPSHVSDCDSSRRDNAARPLPASTR